MLNVIVGFTAQDGTGIRGNSSLAFSSSSQLGADNSHCLQVAAVTGHKLVPPWDSTRQLCPQRCDNW
jgi:hypothetical protein